MGTSSSKSGRSNQSQLIPSDVDANPDQPLPEPEGRRFQGFRTEFGRAIRSEDTIDFTSALGKYARKATGGVSIGPRRLGSAYLSGGDLIALLSELSQGGTGEDSIGINLSSLVGKPVQEAVEQIAQTLSPENTDAEVIRISMQEALVEAFPDSDIFEPSDLSSDDLITISVEFFSKLLFHIVLEDAGNAWNKAPNEQRTIEAENQLFDIVRTSVDNHLSKTLTNDIQNLTKSDIATLERSAIDDVWAEWESYE